MSAIDWEAVRRRVEAAGRPPRTDRAQLVARARSLALPLPEAGPAGDETLDLVVFRLGGERFAVDAERVLEALPLGEPTPVPGEHPWLLGLVAHRGGVLGVFDLSEALRPAAPPAAPTHVVAVAQAGLTFGIAADGVDETRRAPAGELRPPPPGPFRGMTEDALIVLDLEALAADERLRIDDAE
jgi:purine-binding chemotaxis protein CheW